MKTTTFAFAIGLAAVLCLALVPAAANNGGDQDSSRAKQTVSDKDVQQLAARYYARGIEAYTAGKLISARSRFRAALRLDPAHANAGTMLQAVETKLGITDKDRLNEKLVSPVARVELEKAPLKEVVEFLAREAGVNIVFEASALRLLAAPTDTAAAAPAAAVDTGSKLVPVTAPSGPVRRDLITIHLRNVPLREVLKYVLRFKGLKYIVEDYALLIVPVDWVGDDSLVTEVFLMSTGDTGARQIRKQLTHGTGVANTY